MLGSGATAGMVVAISVTGGTGYTVVPTVTIDPPPLNVGVPFNVVVSATDRDEGTSTRTSPAP